MKPYYEEKGIQVFHGDCREVLPQIETRSAEIAITSPPYNLIRKWTESNGPNSVHGGFVEAAREVWYEDELPEEEYQARQKEVIQELFRVCRSSVFYNHKLRYGFKRIGRVVHPLEWLAEFPLWCEII